LEPYPSQPTIYAQYPSQPGRYSNFFLLLIFSFS
jgi:hypothetical protein